MILCRIVCACATLLLFIGPATGFAAEKTVAEEILDVLRANEQISEQQYDDLVLRVRDETARRQNLTTPAVAASKESWVDRFTLSGDFRGRYEGFWYDRDPANAKLDSRNRMRMRTRLGLKAKVNDRIDFKLRLASDSTVAAPGTNSRNQTFGQEPDFGPDGLFLDQAYISLHPFEKGSVPFGGKKLEIMFGKMGNPFKSKIGKDYLIWDGDLTPEGLALVWAAEPSERLGLTVRSGYFILDEDGGQADPYMTALQVGTSLSPSEALELGLNLSYYRFDSLDDGATAEAFFVRARGAGNLTGGLTGNSLVNLGDARAWLRFGSNESWPVLVYGNVVKNYSAKHTTVFGAGGKEDLGWSLGLEVGSKKKFAQLGIGYFRLESNAVPANLTDSDLFDGATNREGFAIYGARQVFPSTDLKFTLFLGDARDNGIAANTGNADRTRLQTDIVVKF